MTIQMTVRLSDASGRYIDELVRAGLAPSRAVALDRMVRREKRRASAAHDALIYATHGEDPELVAWVEGATHDLKSMDLDR